jgi:hypothetical protein
MTTIHKITQAEADVAHIIGSMKLEGDSPTPQVKAILFQYQIGALPSTECVRLLLDLGRKMRDAGV